MFQEIHLAYNSSCYSITTDMGSADVNFGEKMECQLSHNIEHLFTRILVFKNII